ncbi:Transposon Ty3-I Gag-Pol polyprotein [Senna tora]|uniref:Transposon Ty3-I Gag-Pol polyprotein n=2 Tax=Senna tora TaxID=362788 RepID=A0A835CIM7_9FABA|nr:Transposon Ty3-I Gag-Pol polyprotein [Senna tora]
MADNTRAKDLATRLDKLQETMDEREARYAARFDQIEQTVGSFDRLEKTVESIARAVDAIIGSLERLKLPDSESDKPLPDQQALVPQPYQPFHTRSVKLDFPRFNGSDPLHWLFKAEKFFAYYETPDDQRVTIVAVHFEGVVVPWFQMMCKSSRFDSWVALSKAIEVEFGPSQFESPRALLFKLYQKSSVAEFYHEFMILATRVEAVRRDVIAQAPSSLLRASALARLFDERSSFGYSASSSKGSLATPLSIVPVPSPQVSMPLNSSIGLVPVSSSSTSPSTPGSGKSSLPPLLPTPNVPPLRSVKRMSAAEMQLRREKKLCFTCDAPYSWSHKCPNKHYMILQIEPDEDGEPPTLETPPDAPSTDPSPSDTQPHHLSLNALSGEHAVGTIRFTGKIRGMEVQVLLDGGSSDNFIQPRLVRTLKLAVEPVSPFKVLVGNGHVLTGCSLVKSIPMLIQGHEIIISAHVLEVTGADIILGAQWLATLRPHIADYSTATIKFYCNSHFITLHGEPKPVAKVAQFHHLKRLTNMDAIFECFAIQAQHVVVSSSRDHLPQQVSPDLERLLHKFQDVFAIPHGLPLPRSHDHQILLHDDTPTDASSVGIGAVLSQEGRPIAFLSKKMSTRMQNRSAYAREMFAITEAVAKFRHYLIGHFFTIRTDQKSLRHLTDQTLQTPEQEEWLPKLLGFQFTIEYKPGKLNTVADALSRSCYLACSSPVFSILDDVRQAVQADSHFARVISECIAGTSTDPHHTWKDGLLYYKNRIMVPTDAVALKQAILWFPALSWAEYWYNTAYHTANGMTPFKAVYGRDPPHLLRYAPTADDPAEVRDQLLHHDKILQRLKTHLLRSQERMKRFADKKRSELQFQVGDMVFFRLQPYRQHSIHLRRSQKLGLRFFGPFPVVERIGEVAYRLQLPSHARIHDVFHVSQLKPCIGSAESTHVPLPLLTTEQGPVISPMAILRHRQILVGEQWEPQLLVAWDDDSSLTWESFTEFKRSYPSFDLEDKVHFNGRGNVMITDDKQIRVEGPRREQQANPSDEGPNEETKRRSTRMKKPTWKYSGRG